MAYIVAQLLELMIASKVRSTLERNGHEDS